MNPSLPSTTEFAAFVALDWADQKHAWAMQAAGPARVQYGELENTPEAVEVWASELEQRFGGRPLAVALEQPRGAVVAVLSKYAHLVLFPVHPNTLAHYRQSFYPSGAKSDPSDAGLLLELLVQHPLEAGLSANPEVVRRCYFPPGRRSAPALAQLAGSEAGPARHLAALLPST